MPHPASPEPVIRFGVFELDGRTGELRKAGVRLKVADQSIQVLATLLERPRELVTREELRNRLWPNDTVAYAWAPPDGSHAGIYLKLIGHGIVPRLTTPLA